MTKGMAFRPQLLPPQGRQLKESRRPSMTCVTVSGSIALLISVIFGLTAYNIYSHRFGRNEHRFHAGDEVSLRQASLDLSPTFCSAYTVRPLGWGDFYLLPHEASLDPTKRVNMSFTMTARSGQALFIVRTHYLMEHSTAVLSACRNSSELAAGHPADELPTEFLVIAGDASFKEWHKHFSNHHVQHRVPIPQNATCDSATSLPHLALTITKPANYYFVLILHHEVSLQRPLTRDVTLKASISRSRFNLSNAVKICNATEESCQVSLQWGSHPDIVVELHNDPDKADTVAPFITHCEERLEFWIPVFGVLPAILITLMSLLCWHLLVRRQSLHSRYRVSEVSRVSNPSYGSFREETAPLVAEPPAQSQVPQDEEGVASIQS